MFSYTHNNTSDILIKIVLTSSIRISANHKRVFIYLFHVMAAMLSGEALEHHYSCLLNNLYARQDQPQAQH